MSKKARIETYENAQKRMSAKTKRIIKICVAGFLAFCVLGGVITMTALGMIGKGNMPQYYVSKAPVNENSSLNGKTVIFLGSSVTYGYAAFGNSFVELLEHCDGIIPVKEAVSGTTLVDNGDKSYVARLKTIDKDINAYCFICQLSTNDATKNMPLGELSLSFNKEDFDTSTIIGAIEYIIAYASETWNCPVAFYTGTKYDSESYEAMVNALHQVEGKWHIGVIDLWNNEEMNAVSPEGYKLYMADGIHPTLAGYRWWLPEFEKYLENAR